MANNLLIVESPAKAKTIEKILGKDFIVMSSYGHIRDLAKGNAAIDVKNNFNATYIIDENKEKVVKELKKHAKGKEVWLATDEDREGEAISWHLCEALMLDIKNTKRIVFHEITKPVILRAIKSPRLVNMDLVNAQQARRVLDRLVGFELSPILWRKLRAAQSLSAGRVQSVAVRLIVEKEREIQNFTSQSYFKIIGIFEITDPEGKLRKFKAELSQKLNDSKLITAFLKTCIGAQYSISKLEVSPTKRTATAPFTTSTLQQEASRKLGFSVSKTMVVAQRLYEAGKITYMRTDSTNLSEEALTNCENEIIKSYGSKYSNTRQYRTKNSSAQEAHEAIRPTYFENHKVDGDKDEQRLYELIWKRTVASQMADAQLEKTTAHIAISTASQYFIAQGEVVLFDGFLRLYKESNDEESESNEDDKSLLPPLSQGQDVNHIETTATQKFTRHTARYTEASLVKKLEELGIGRPSTYAPTISTVQKRQYVIKKDKEGYERMIEIQQLIKDKISQKQTTETADADRNKLFPTDLGMLTNDFLLEHFDTVLDFSFTAKIEQEFDEIANGKLKWQKMLSDFYKPFHDQVETTASTAKRISGERLLGIDPKTNKEVFAKMGRFGPMIQIGKTVLDENATESKSRKKKIDINPEDKPLFAKLRTNQSIDTITIEEALQLFDLPRIIGKYEDMEVVVNEGRFGPYIVHNKEFVSLKKIDDPYTLTIDRAIELIEEKRNTVLRVFENEDIRILQGRWGPYIKQGKSNVKLPKGTDAALITIAECLALIKKSNSASVKKSLNSK